MTDDELRLLANSAFDDRLFLVVKQAYELGRRDRQKQDAEICEKASEYDPNAVEGAMKSKRWIEEVE